MGPNFSYKNYHKLYSGLAPPCVQFHVEILSAVITLHILLHLYHGSKVLLLDHLSKS